MQAVSAELYWLTAVALMTGLMWVPYILQLLGQMGVAGALMDGQHETPHEAAWARRAKRAHTNAVENLVVFAPLAIGVHVLGGSTPLTAMVSAIFFFSRAGHYVVYVLGLPLVRTLLFAVGVACQVILAARILGWV